MKTSDLIYRPRYVFFFKRSVAENGIPFSMKLGNYDRDAVRARIPQNVLSAMQAMAQSATSNGISDMSLEEINTEIDAARKR